MLAPDTSQDHRWLGELPSEDARTRVELLSRVAEDGSAVVDLVEYSWGTGLGWYVQKRLTLDAAQVDALRILLGAAPAAPTKPATLLRPVALREDNVIQLVFPA
ncbi:MAG: hypothetical protein ACO1SX_25615 [Actinomycetota bacterium]